jgi:hypothetical protein
LKIPPSTTTGAAANARLNRGETTAAGVEKLATPGGEPAGAGAPPLSTDSFEKAAPSPFGALLGDRRTIWSGGIEPTLQATPESVDTSATAPPTATGEHERATIPQELDRTGNPIARTRAPVDFATALAQEDLGQMVSSLVENIATLLPGANSPEALAGLTDAINSGFQNIIATAQRMFDSLLGFASTADDRDHLSKTAARFLDDVHTQWDRCLETVAKKSEQL